MRKKIQNQPMIRSLFYQESITFTGQLKRFKSWTFGVLSCSPVFMVFSSLFCSHHFGIFNEALKSSSSSCIACGFSVGDFISTFLLDLHNEKIIKL
mmetsp:Transcript_13090/g.17535  ORF Transcript_13090/g.17535 Transcript_13090/m.17535 type:complete len:96 (-) Transcript_13090:13-300(-)